MYAFSPEHWSDFFVAEIGATAALAGLLTVAISINLKAIVEGRLLSGRAAETILMLGGVLVLSTLALVPGQGVVALGYEELGLGVIIGCSRRLSFCARDAFIMNRKGAGCAWRLASASSFLCC